jgi:hypothetical protein
LSFEFCFFLALSHKSIYNILVKSRHLIFAIVLLALLAVPAGCSSGTPVPTPLPSASADQALPGPGDVPIVLPTYDIPQPAGINPGRIIGTVYVSSKDHYFHTRDCPNLGPGATAIDRQSALLEGYTADPFCHP